MDIEDLPSGHTERPKNVMVKSRFKKQNLEALLSSASGDNIPGVQRIFVQVWGCAHNTSDAEYMAGLLSSYGYHVTLGGSEDHNIEETERRINSCDLADCCLQINTNKLNSTHHLIGGGEESQQDCEELLCDSESCCAKTGVNEFSGQLPSSEDQFSRKSEQSARDAADLWLLNSCTVKGPAEDHFRNAVMAGKLKGKKVVVAGCVPQGSPDAKYLKNVSVVGVQQIDRVVEVVEQTLLGNTVRFMEKRIVENDFIQQRLAGAPLSLPKIRRNPLIEILAISTGCLNACTYCKTKHARGMLASYPITELVDRAREAFLDGVKELWLTSEDLGAYGRDLPRSGFALPTFSEVTKRWPNNLTLADLLFNLVPIIPPGCMLRLGMTNPPYILDQLDEIASILRHPRVYSFIHIPVQSGSNKVLKDMRREYLVEDFEKVVSVLTEYLKSEDLRLTIATDLICGFPTETETEFQDTVSLVNRHKFPVLYINQFFSRPGTPAASMKREASTSEVKKRTRLLHDIFRSYRPYSGLEGNRCRVLITERSTDALHWVGHTKAYEQILLPKEPNLKGRIVLVEITECDKFFMRGRILDRGPFDTITEEVTNSPISMNLLSPGPCGDSTIFRKVVSRCRNWKPKNLVPVFVIILLIAWIATKVL